MQINRWGSDNSLSARLMPCFSFAGLTKDVRSGGGEMLPAHGRKHIGLQRLPSDEVQGRAGFFQGLLTVCDACMMSSP